MSNTHIIVTQVQGYYRLKVQMFINAEEDALFGLHAVQPVLNKLAADIQENFDVSQVRVDVNNTSLLVKCLRPELRKIETWLSLQDYILEPLKRWNRRYIKKCFAIKTCFLP